MIRFSSSRLVRTALAVSTAAVASFSFVAGTAGTASADTLAGVILCTAHLPTFPAPSGNSGTCVGTASGAQNTTALVNASFSSSFSYTEPCPAVIGTASGNTSFNGNAGPNFSWTRVGLTAVLLLNHGSTSGAAAGIFVPLDPNPAQFEPGCGGNSIPIDAQVVAVGVDAL